MTSPRVRPVLIAVLCILAIALAAATLNSAVAVDGEFGFGEGPGSGPGSGASGQPNASSSPPPLDVDMEGWRGDFPMPCVPFLASPLFQFSALLVVAVAGYLLSRRAGPFLPIGLAIAFGPFVVLVYFILTACTTRGALDESAEPREIANVTSGVASEAGEALAGGGGSVSVPSLLLLGALAAVLLAAIALLLVSSSDQRIDLPEPDGDDDPGPAPEAIGRIAGRAADRIEDDATLENEVFRAWHEMTTYLDVPNPESSSPGEFADAAVDAGMDRQDVTRLTRLFEAVRYGDVEPTAERERRAVDALRRIEETYAEGPP